MKNLIATAVLLSVLVLPFAVSAQAGAGDVSACSNLSKGDGITGIVSCIVGFINYAIYLIMALAVLYVIWGAFQLMREDKRDEGKNIVLYGILGLFVMISIWGFVNILDRTFNLSDDAQRAPQLIPSSK